jgi:hypothetical protein
MCVYGRIKGVICTWARSPMHLGGKMPQGLSESNVYFYQLAPPYYSQSLLLQSSLSHSPRSYCCEPNPSTTPPSFLPPLSSVFPLFLSSFTFIVSIFLIQLPGFLIIISISFRFRSQRFQYINLPFLFLFSSIKSAGHSSSQSTNIHPE